MDQNQAAGSYGAVDLSGAGANPYQGQPAGAQSPAAGMHPGGGQAAGAPVVGIQVPLVSPVTEADFEEQMGLSQTVPVILLFISAGSLPSNQAQTRLEQVARASEGAFAIRTVDIAQSQGIATALQIQSVPTAIALVARRPVPLFEGVPTETQLESLVSQLLEAAAQLGVSGRVQLSAEDLEEKEPESHAAPRAAEEQGNWEEAIALWKKVLANDPSDSAAKLALTRAEFEARYEQGNADADPLAQADALFASGDESGAFDFLLDQVQNGKDDAAKEDARTRLVQLFALATDKDAVKKARQRLTGLLF